MNNKSFIQRLAQITGYTQDDSQKMVYSVVDAMNERFQEGENVLLPGFGTFEVKKRMERIVVNPNTRQRLLVPPKLVLSFRPTASIRKVLKDGGVEPVESTRVRKGELTSIVNFLIQKHGLPVGEAEHFVVGIISTLNEGLRLDKLVKVKGFGTFKVVDVKERESVDVNTGERIVIEGRSKIAFTPDSVMKDLVNKPFSQFETVVLNEGVTFDDIEVSDTDDEPDMSTEEESMMTDEPENEEEIVGEGLEPAEEQVVEEPEPLLESPSALMEEAIVEVSIPEEPETKEPSDEDSIHEETLVEESLPEKATIISMEEETEEPKTTTETEENPDMNEEQNICRRTPWCPFVLTALIAAAIGFGGGWFARGMMSGTGNAEPEPIILVETDSIAPTDSIDAAKKAAEQALRDSIEQVRRDSIETARRDSIERVRRDSLEKVQKDLERVKKELEAQKEAEAKAKQEAQKVADAKAKQEAQKKAEQQAAQAAALDNSSLGVARRQAELGAYRIVGTQETIIVKEGQTLARISKFYFGDGMECYLQVHNGVSEVKPGMKLKIPKLQIKKKH